MNKQDRNLILAIVLWILATFGTGFFIIPYVSKIIEIGFGLISVGVLVVIMSKLKPSKEAMPL